MALTGVAARDGGPLVEIRDTEVNGEIRRVLWRDGTVIAVEPPRSVSSAPVAAERIVVDAGGGALLPGLWDHHLHLAAMAAAENSVRVGPPEVADIDGLARVLRSAAPDGTGWIRAVAYHESVAGDLDAIALDAVMGPRASVPVRVQHRTGQMWILNSAAIAAGGLAESASAAVERDATGAPTGRVFADGETAVPRIDPRDVATRIAAVIDGFVADGVTGVTDLTPSGSVEDVEMLRTAAGISGAVRLAWTGAVHLAVPPGAPGRVAAKFLPPDHADPDLDELIAGFRAAREAGTPVAVHCVTRVGAVVAIAAWREVGAAPGDRMEHGAVLDGSMMSELRDMGVAVVTQPNFVAERGDHYLADVAPDDVGHLWRCGSLRTAGVRVAGGTDAPFGGRDPWAAMRAAVDRRTPSGTLLGAHEALHPADALALFLGRPDRPWEMRRVAPGEATDLCLLGVPAAEALGRLERTVVRATIGAGGVREVSGAR